MISLTIGYVSGIIAAIIFVLQFLLPNALIIVLVGLLKNEHSAVTWSVVERNLLSSMW
jgi:chromate transport protein ChrA